MHDDEVNEEIGQLRRQMVEFQATLRVSGARERANVLAAESRINQLVVANTDAMVHSSEKELL
eukprot:374040-Lingulodinium_polyedra.AAC.1